MTPPEPLPSLIATLACYEGMFGPYHPQTLALTTELAVALCASGKSSEGKRLLERAIGDLTKHQGKHHPGSYSRTGGMVRRLGPGGRRAHKSGEDLGAYFLSSSGKCSLVFSTLGSATLATYGLFGFRLQ